MSLGVHAIATAVTDSTNQPVGFSDVGMLFILPARGYHEVATLPRAVHPPDVATIVAEVLTLKSKGVAALAHTANPLVFIGFGHTRTQLDYGATSTVRSQIPAAPHQADLVASTRTRV